MAEVLRAHARQQYAELHELNPPRQPPAPTELAARPGRWRPMCWAGSSAAASSSRRSISAAAAWSRSRSPRWRPTADCCCWGCPAPPRAGWPSTWPPRSRSDSTMLIQGLAGTSEEAVRYGWNYARLLADGPSEAALVASPLMRAMRGQDRPDRGADAHARRCAGHADHDHVEGLPSPN